MSWIALLMLLAQDRQADPAQMLLSRQAPDGSWGKDAVFGQDVNIRSAITVLAIRALQASDIDAKDAIRRGMEFVATHSHKRPRAPSYGLYDFSFYSSSYALTLLTDPAALERCLKTLQENQRSDGGFTYVHPAKIDTYESFTTALVLLNNLDARCKIPEDFHKRALDALKKTRTPDGYFCYHHIKGKQHGSLSGNRTLAREGSLVRSVVAELALLRQGEGKVELLKKSIEDFFKHHDELEAVRKKNQRTHQGPYDNAPYYFLFGHYYVALALKECDAAFRAEMGKKLLEVMSKIRESDGSWLDGSVTGKDYGLAMGLLVTKTVRPGHEY